MLAGVLLAVGVAELVGLTWWSLGAVVGVSLVVGRFLRLGSNLLEVPISAMIVLAVGGNSALALRSLCRALLDRTYFVPEPEQGDAYSWEVRHALADVLEEAAGALAVVGAYAGDIGVSRDGLAALDVRLAALLSKRDVLSSLMLIDPLADEAAWQQHGALLAGVDRLRTEIESTSAPAVQPRRPLPVAARQREALRRVIIRRTPGVTTP